MSLIDYMNSKQLKRARRRWSFTSPVLVSLLALSACTAKEEEARVTEDSLRAEFIASLLEEMNLEEKVGQMALIDSRRITGTNEWDRGPLNPEWMDIIFDQAKTGGVFSGGDAGPLPNTPLAWAEHVNDVQHYAVEHSRLGIPILYGIDAVHGLNPVAGATIFPHSLGLAASRDPDLAREISARTAEAARATGINWVYGPLGDIGKDPRWGRFYETFGEDHVLAAEMVAGAVEGLQGGSLAAPDTVAATAKHFVGYGQPEAGQDRMNAEISMRSLQDQHLEPFRRAIAAGVAAIMPNSGAVNGVPGHSSKYLLTDVLRGELGFQGLVVSDWNDFHYLVDRYAMAEDYHQAVEIGIEAGVDMYMVPHNALEFTNIVLDLVNDGRLSVARVDEAVGRILGLKYDLGLFENPYIDPEQASAVVVGGDTDLALEAAQKAIVLLQNDAEVLPLQRKSKVLVTGLSADSGPNLMGGWTIGWQGASNPDEQPPAVTVLQGIQDKIGSGRVVHAPGVPMEAGATSDEIDALRAEAVAAAADVDVAVVVAGETPYAEYLGDTTDMTLAADQQALVSALAATGTPVVVVLVQGRPLIMDEVLESADALLMAHLPGTQGGNAIADVLFGDYNPSGHLAFSWPKRVGQIPINYNSVIGAYEGLTGEGEERVNDPLYSFGYGLSYTQFRQGGLAIADRRVTAEDMVTAWVEVDNLGTRSGEDVVELYVRPKASAVSKNRLQLVAFERVQVEPGQGKTVQLSFPVSLLAVTLGDVTGEGPRVVQPGDYELIGENDGMLLEFTVE